MYNPVKTAYVGCDQTMVTAFLGITKCHDEHVPTFYYHSSETVFPEHFQ